MWLLINVSEGLSPCLKLLMGFGRFVNAVGGFCSNYPEGFCNSSLIIFLVALSWWFWRLFFFFVIGSFGRSWAVRLILQSLLYGLFQLIRHMGMRISPSFFEWLPMKQRNLVHSLEFSEWWVYVLRVICFFYSSVIYVFLLFLSICHIKMLKRRSDPNTEWFSFGLFSVMFIIALSKFLYEWAIFSLVNLVNFLFQLLAQQRWALFLLSRILNQSRDHLLLKQRKSILSQDLFIWPWAIEVWGAACDVYFHLERASPNTRSLLHILQTH